jgi:hypothetical protein
MSASFKMYKIQINVYFIQILLKCYRKWQYNHLVGYNYSHKNVFFGFLIFLCSVVRNFLIEKFQVSHLQEDGRN